MLLMRHFRDSSTRWQECTLPVHSCSGEVCVCTHANTHLEPGLWTVLFSCCLFSQTGIDLLHNNFIEKVQLAANELRTFDNNVRARVLHASQL